MERTLQEILPLLKVIDSKAVHPGVAAKLRRAVDRWETPATLLDDVLNIMLEEQENIKTKGVS